MTTDRILTALLLVSLAALGVWSAWVNTADATPLSTPQYGTEYKAPIPTLINLAPPVLIGAGPCRYYTGTQYGSVPATALVWLDAVDLDANTATYRRVVYWPNKRVPSNPFDDTQGETTYTLVMTPWATRLDAEIAVSGERYEWEVVK